MTLRILRLAVPPLAAGMLVLAGCADQDQLSGADPAAAAAGEDQEYEVTGIVLESPDHGPQLCSGVAESMPPRCSGPDVVGWDWSEVESDSFDGTTMGGYDLVGTWDGERFTLTRPPRPAEPGDQAPDEPGIPTPCPEPAGGWQPIDPDTATQEALDAALSRAAKAPDYAGAWVDQSYLDELGELDDHELERLGNDPTRLVLNLRFTGDLAEREQWIREVWGGALCVSGATHSEAKLRDIQVQLCEKPSDDEFSDMVRCGVDEKANVVVLMLYVADAERQRELDRRYGEGVVILQSWLGPLPVEESVSEHE